MSGAADQIAWSLRYIRELYGEPGGKWTFTDGSNPAYRHGGPDAGWYRRTMDGWRRVSDTEAATGRYEDMRHFMHDPRTVTDMEPKITVRKHTAYVPVAVNEDGVPLSHGEPMVEVEPGYWMDATALAELHAAGLDHNYQPVTDGPDTPET